MKKLMFVSSILISLGITSLGFLSRNKPEETVVEFAPEGMVAYAASYSSDEKSEPQWSAQNSKTFQYLNICDTLNFYRGDSVKVGIIDSGINYDHEDFVVNNQTKVKGDSKYYSYQTSQWVYYKASQHGYSYINDTLGHGTNVAATVAAAINGIGGTGLAPNVELYIYKVTNSSNGYEFGAIQNALMDAKTLGLDVVNMSFQSYEHEVKYGSSTMPASSGCSSILSYYLNQAHNAGITLVGAAGNYNTTEPSYPGSNNYVINVGSLNDTGTGKAPFSNYGSTIDLVAPGYVHVADEASNSAYTDTQGTSFSAPLVTAAIALYKQQNPSATPSEIEQALYASCDPFSSDSQYSNWAGHGALNVAKFLGLDEDGPREVVINNEEVVNEELELYVGDTFDLDWTVNGVGSFDDSVSIYPFEDNGTLSVDENGHIAALQEGADYIVIESNEDPNVYASVYVNVTTKPHRVVIEGGVDIGGTEDCLGLESFIETYMHMDYVENLGYCKDSEHHYYSTAKTEFNKLNEHQRLLFSTNEAYDAEWSRLSTWADINGDVLNSINQLSNSNNGITNVNESKSSTIIIVVITITSITSLGVLLVIKKRRIAR